MRAATRRERCSLVRFTTGKPRRSCRVEGHVRRAGFGSRVGSPRGMGGGTYGRFVPEQERPVCAALVGASGLGVPVIRALNTVNTSLGFESGFVIVVVAIMLDRMLRVKSK